ncbi:serine/threonine-protein kinase phg2-like [Chenopodium quinoa]|uniref:serine/threonine-protein kinase phg2-like n=1 Tax=Chenopodium quinoa TaxID=63459 RepID=UPI000B788EBA|nr:serine/threonine-protein kinase phg2-like [Chenopodium quinoa]
MIDFCLGSRIRFFLFKKEEPVRDLKCDDDWFADALKVASSSPANNNNNNNTNNNSNDSSSSAPESIVLESSSSFGSNSSSSNSPGKNNKVGVADDFKVVLPSVDSLGSDCSIPSPNFSQQGIVYQDASGFFDSNPASVNPVETESNASDRSPRSDILTSVQVSGYMVSKPMGKPQHQSPPQPPSLATATPHYIHYAAPQSNYAPQYYPNSIPVASYTPMYPTYVQPHQPVQYQLNKPYPVYMMPMGQTQNLYDASMPCTMTTAPNVARSQPHVPSNPVVVSPR